MIISLSFLELSCCLLLFKCSGQGDILAKSNAKLSQSSTLHIWWAISLTHLSMIFSSTAKASYDHFIFSLWPASESKQFFERLTQSIIPWPLFVELIFYNCNNFNSALRVTVPLSLVSFPNLINTLYSSRLLIKVLISYGYRDTHSDRILLSKSHF